MAGPFTRIMPGPHLDSVDGLSRRVSALERYHGEFEPMEVVVDTPEGGERVVAAVSRIARVDVGAMWKAVLTDDSGTYPKFSVKGGIVVVQGTRVEVADVAELVATSETGYIVLAVVRNSASRAYDAGSPPAIGWHSTVPTSTYATEYTVLAEYLTGSVAQCRNDEICSYELMISALGEFKLLAFQSNSRNEYDLPP